MNLKGVPLCVSLWLQSLKEEAEASGTIAPKQKAPAKPRAKKPAAAKKAEARFTFPHVFVFKLTRRIALTRIVQADSQTGLNHA